MRLVDRICSWGVVSSQVGDAHARTHTPTHTRTHTHTHAHTHTYVCTLVDAGGTPAGSWSGSGELVSRMEFEKLQRKLERNKAQFFDLKVMRGAAGDAIARAYCYCCSLALQLVNGGAD